VSFRSDYIDLPLAPEFRPADSRTTRCTSPNPSEKVTRCLMSSLTMATHMPTEPRPPSSDTPSNTVGSTMPALRGGLLALGAAALFGVSTPLLQIAGRGVGAFTTAALLYAGAAVMGALLRRPIEREARVQRRDLARLVCMALFGAVMGPVALAWGLQQTSGTSASLMLTLEALFTAVLARWFYGETIGRRVWAAMGLLMAGGMALVVDRGASGGAQLWGLLAVLAATLAWGVDNTLSKALAQRDPGQVVMAKSALGVLATAALSLAGSEPPPAVGAVVALLAIGATGYGLSLRLYLLAQRAFGVARTGSVFAFAPFIGALLAFALGDRSSSWGMALGCLLMLAGVALHLAESHAHKHGHESIEHEHAHTHDDDHHDHAHDPAPTEPHSHRHHHEPRRHAHAHVPEAHHTHVH